MSEIKIQMNHVGLNDIKQTTINDAWNTKLCIALCDMQIAASILKMPFDLKDADRCTDEAIRRGGLLTKDGKNSDNGFVASHEILAEIVGLKGYVKKYEKFDAAKLFALLQWGSLVELRDEDHHSLLATGWYKEGEKFYCTTSDPWTYSDDKRLDTARAMTQKLDKNGKLIDSRSIEMIGYYVKKGTDWI